VEPTSKVREFPFEPLHFTYTGTAVCVGKPSPFSTGTRSACAYDKANLPHHLRKQWNTWAALVNDRFDSKALQLFWGHVRVCVD